MVWYGTLACLLVIASSGVSWTHFQNATREAIHAVRAVELQVQEQHEKDCLVQETERLQARLTQWKATDSPIRRRKSNGRGQISSQRRRYSESP